MKKILLALAGSLLAFAVMAQEGNKVEGEWLTQESDSKIVIKKTDSGSYVGEIVWLKDPKEQDGSDKLDKNNPDEQLQKRKIVGLKLLEGFKYDADDEEWVDGTIYDPKSGNTYKCYMWFDKDPNVLNVKGYIGVSIIGRKVQWTRAKS